MDLIDQQDYKRYRISASEDRRQTLQCHLAPLLTSASSWKLGDQIHVDNQTLQLRAVEIGFQNKEGLGKKLHDATAEIGFQGGSDIYVTFGRRYQEFKVVRMGDFFKCFDAGSQILIPLGALGVTAASAVFPILLLGAAGAVTARFAVNAHAQTKRQKIVFMRVTTDPPFIAHTEKIYAMFRWHETDVNPLNPGKTGKIKDWAPGLMGRIKKIHRLKEPTKGW